MFPLILETGDVTTKLKGTRRLRIDVDRPPTKVELSLSDVGGSIRFEEWPNLVEQVKNKDLVNAQFPGGVQPPLSQIAQVVQQIKSTPTFQLFLAGIDIAERIYLVSETSPESVMRRFRLLDKWMPSVTGAGGLFFVPEEMSIRFQPKPLAELLLNNKLCLATFGDSKCYYVPYATPIGFVLKTTREAEALWDDIRTLYYAFRSSA